MCRKTLIEEMQKVTDKECEVEATEPVGTKTLIRQECDAIRDLLLQKNKEYGDSAINPLRIFSITDQIEQINVRIDDKLSRIKNRTGKTIQEDTVQDLIGYLILLRVAKRVKNPLMMYDPDTGDKVDLFI